MVLHGTVPLAYGFDCLEQVQFPRPFTSVQLYYGYSVNSIFAKPSFVSCTQFNISFKSKKSVCWNSTLSSKPCYPGPRCQIHPMIARKGKIMLQYFHHCFHISGVERRRLITARASVAESSIKDLGNGEIPVESGKEDNANDHHSLPYGLKPYLMPKHVAIIMDGNSRWAEQRGLPSTEGTAQVGQHSPKLSNYPANGASKFLLYLPFQQIIGVDQRENIRLCVIGDLAVLTKSLQTSIVEAEEMTKHNSRLNLVIALSYSGRNDIVQACQRLAGQVEDGNLKATDITESLFEKELETSCVGDFASPDLLIRTSGEQRLSNFLLWQLAYTEIYFDNSLWPEFGEVQFAEAYAVSAST